MSASARAYLDRLLVGESPAMQRVKELIIKVAPSDLAVLIEGETGTGKELAAEALHHLSGRSGKFVPVNVCAIPESMFEAELFGYVRGAFTGAAGEHVGLIAEACGGTLLLDEIGSLSLAGQAKLLRVIETKRYRRLGERCERVSDFRLLSASNSPIAQLVATGAVRADLAFRLRGMSLELPPLRQRGADKARLATHFAGLVARTPGAGLRISTGALERLEQHDWPGNVRELKWLVASAAILSSGDTICAGAVEATLRVPPAAGRAGTCARTQTIDAIREAGGDAIRAASILGVSRATLYRRARRAGVVPSTIRALEPPRGR